MNPEAGRPTVQKNNITKLIATILFIVVGTHTEILEVAEGTGYALIIKTSAAFLLFILLGILRGVKVSPNELTFSVVVITYFNIVNIAGDSNQIFIVINLVLWGLLFASAYVNRSRDLLIFITTGYIYFNLFGFAIAGGIYLRAGEIVDLHNLVFFWSNARVMETGGFARLTGFQIEPGNYAAFMYLMMLLRSLLIGRLGTKLHLMTAVTCILTFSVWALPGISVFLLGCATEVVLEMGRSRLRRAMLFLLAVSTIVAGPLMVNLLFNTEFVETYAGFVTNYATESSSSNAKQEAFDRLELRLGEGIGLGKPMSEGFCTTCKSPQDIGTVPNMLYYLGVIPVGLLLLTLFHRLWSGYGVAYIVAFFPLMICKAYFYDPIIWLIFGVILFKRNTSPEKRKILWSPRMEVANPAAIRSRR